MISDFTKTALTIKRLKSMFITASSSSGSAEDSVVIGVGEDGTPVHWPRPSLEQASHITVLAASGAGKTILVVLALLLELLRDQQVEEEDRPAYLIVDPKGDLVSGFLQGLAALAPHRLGDLVYLDPFSAAAFPFNVGKLALGKTPLDIRAAQLAALVSEVSTATGVQKHLGVGARQLDVLQHTILGALDCAHPQATVLWALDALAVPGGLKMLARLTRSQRAKQFLESAILSDELRASCAARLRTAFAASDNLERLVTAPTCIQFADLLAPGRLMLVNLGEPMGGLLALQSFWSNLVVRLAVEFLMERPSPWSGHHARLVVDEAQVVAPVLSDVAERVLTTGRSRGVSLLTLSQGTTLLADASDTLLRVLMTNTPRRIIGRLSAPDATLFARDLAPRLGVDESVRITRERFSTVTCNLNDREFFMLTPGKRARFTSLPIDLQAWEQASEARAAEIETVKSRLAVPVNQPLRLTLRQAVAALQTRKPQAGASRTTTHPSPTQTLWG